MTYRKLLYGAAYGVLHDAGDAEDCVHDVLMRLWQRGHAYTPSRGSLQAFLCVCVRNEALSRQRSRANRLRIERENANAGAVAFDEDAIARGALMERSLSELTPIQREAIQLAYYDGLTHEQIAERLSAPLGTVKSRLSNALQALRRIVGSGDST